MTYWLDTQQYDYHSSSPYMIYNLFLGHYSLLVNQGIRMTVRKIKKTPNKSPKGLQHKSARVESRENLCKLEREARYFKSSWMWNICLKVSWWPHGLKIVLWNFVKQLASKQRRKSKQAAANKSKQEQARASKRKQAKASTNKQKQAKASESKYKQATACKSKQHQAEASKQKQAQANKGKQKQAKARPNVWHLLCNILPYFFEDVDAIS